MAARKKKKSAPKKSTAKPKAKAKAPPKKKAPPPAKKAAPKAKKPAPKAKQPAPKKVAAKAAAPKKKAAPAKAKGAAPRRDATGHLNPKYAADLRAKSRESREDLGNDRAFLKKSRSRDGLAEELGEEAVGAMTSGEDQGDRLTDLEVEEESGGPFVRTSGREEYARGTDRSNPRSATREPFPKT